MEKTSESWQAGSRQKKEGGSGVYTGWRVKVKKYDVGNSILGPKIVDCPVYT